VPVNVAAVLSDAIAAHRAGRLAEAEQDYRRVLDGEPGHPDANHNLGILALQQDRADLALVHLSAAHAAVPSCDQYRLSYVDALLRSGQHVAARRILGAKSSGATSDWTRPLFDLAVAHHRDGRVEAAVTAYEAFLALAPNDADALGNLGFALHALGRSVDAQATLRRALAIEPAHVASLNNLGIVLYHAGQFDEAAHCYREALARQPDFADAHGNLGNALRELGRPAEAEASLRRAIELRPGNSDLLSNLGNALRDLGRLEEAETSFRRALDLQPSSVLAHSNLSNVLRELGRVDEALRHLDQALALQPGNIAAHMNVLTTIAYHPTISPAEYFARHRHFEAQVARPLASMVKPHLNDRNPVRRLRIGYLSADFRTHVAARNLLPMLRSHDRTKFEIYLYAEVGQPDSMTAEFRELATGWRSTVGQNDDSVADMIRADRIDILVSLAGRFDRNRPLVCALRPAPIQISSHDIATSGMDAVDYLISDRILAPRHTPERFAERVICLPCFYLADIPADLPPVARREGPPVFGSFNNPSKISDVVLDLWARLLDRLPETRLLLRYSNWYNSLSVRKRVYEALDRYSVARDRVTFPAGAGSYRAHLEIYGEIDVALDTFPFSGSTTTFDALMMGVPVVTMPDWRMVSRWSATMLTGIGLADLIARSPDDYLDIACRLASDPARRATLRDGLRERIERSSLCAASRRVRQIERLYSAVWRRWCAVAGGPA
jgi:protein O-GlcNAc transferase